MAQTWKTGVWKTAVWKDNVWLGMAGSIPGQAGHPGALNVLRGGGTIHQILRKGG